MKTAFTWIKRIGGFLLTVFLAIVFGGLLLFMFIAAPIDFAVTSYDLVRMQSTATGKIIRSKVDREEGLEQSLIKYSFEADGKRYTSNRFMSGWVFSSGHSSDGGAEARMFPQGARATVYYDASNPSRCTLFYGWDKWVVGWMLVTWGTLFVDAPGWRRIVVRSGICYAIGLFFLGPPVVRVDQLHYHVAAYLLATLVPILWPSFFVRSKREKNRRKGFSIQFGT